MILNVNLMCFSLDILCYSNAEYIKHLISKSLKFLYKLLYIIYLFCWHIVNYRHKVAYEVISSDYVVDRVVVQS